MKVRLIFEALWEVIGIIPISKKPFTALPKPQDQKATKN
jgi:hypothetical protein